MRTIPSTLVCAILPTFNTANFTTYEHSLLLPLDPTLLVSFTTAFNSANRSSNQRTLYAAFLQTIHPTYQQTVRYEFIATRLSPNQ